jgi:hypothetical protein
MFEDRLQYGMKDLQDDLNTSHDTSGLRVFLTTRATSGEIVIELVVMVAVALADNASRNS